MSNPVLNESRWEQLARAERGGAMTIGGTIQKTLLLFAVLAVSLGWMWSSFWQGGRIDPAAMRWTLGGAVAGLGIVLLGMFLPRLAALWGLAFAVAEGLFLGGLTMILHQQYPGLPILAACYTAATLFGMLMLYQARIIRATPGLVKGILLATVGLVVGTAIVWVMASFLGMKGPMEALYGSGPIGIGFSVLCVGLAAFNLIVDFAVIEEGAARGAPRAMEWVGAFGLLVTLVWLYVEILRLLAKLRRE